MSYIDLKILDSSDEVVGEFEYDTEEGVRAASNILIDVCSLREEEYIVIKKVIT